MAKILGLTRKIGKGLGEYFLGLQTHQKFKYEKSFLKAHTIEQEAYKLMSDELKREEVIGFINGKVLPNIITATGIGLTVYLKEPYCLFISVFGEQIRMLNNDLSKEKFKNRQKDRQNYIKEIFEKEKKEEERDKRLERLIEEHDEGEEWKIGTEYE